jgi:glucose-6-phosphate 1-dehydrogenase
MTAPAPADARPGVFVLFGGTGDLALRMLFPAFYHLEREGRLPPQLLLAAVARSELTPEAFVESVREAVAGRLAPEALEESAWSRLAARVRYLSADMTTEAGGRELAALIQGRAAPVFYLAVSPSLYAAICATLARLGLNTPDSAVVLEKPIGRDGETSRAINAAVAEAFPEARTFRIDHYLGKETVQNLLALRFGNILFEPLWNSLSVDHVEITIAEPEGVGERLAYYNDYGATRDMVQNHLLQLVTLVAMEPPSSLGADAVRAEKVKVLRSLRRITPERAPQVAVRGQYAGGVSEGRQVAGYTEEHGGPSGTETFVAIRADIDNWRWAGVPFYLRTGKRMAERRTQIVVQFKAVPHSIFGQGSAEALVPNRLIIDLQPQEDIQLTLMNKRPGIGIALQQLPLSLSLTEALGEGSRRRIAYERLFLDILSGDRTLFVSREEIEEAWAWVDELSEAWVHSGSSPKPYAAGGWGPPGAFALIERDGRQWNE